MNHWGGSRFRLRCFLAPSSPSTSEAPLRLVDLAEGTGRLTLDVEGTGVLHVGLHVGVFVAVAEFGPSGVLTATKMSKIVISKTKACSLQAEFCCSQYYLHSRTLTGRQKCCCQN